MTLDPRTPVIVGVAQLANLDDDRIIHPVELIAEVVECAIADSGSDRRLLDLVGKVFATPLSVFSTDDAARMVVERFGLDVTDTFESRYSGASPQRMLSEACRRISDGSMDAALIVGGVAEASVKRARALGIEPPAPPTAMWSQGSTGHRGEHRMREGFRPDGRIAEMHTGGQMPVHMFSMLESAMAAAAGGTTADHRRHLGALMAGFTEVAATRPGLAWFPTARSSEEISGVRTNNRLVTEHYTKLMCSFPTVDLAAAVIVCSAEEADRLGIPGDARVHPWSIAAASDAPPSQWPSLDRSPAMGAALGAVLASSGIDVDDIAAFDLYSCFPAAVELALGALGIAHDDPRPFTLTGGLPYFGGPGASYSLHGIVSMVERCRENRDEIGLVVGLGGMPNDFAGVVLSSAVARTAPRFIEVEPATDANIATAFEVEGVATCEATTLGYGSDGRVEVAPMLARLGTGERVGARPARDLDLEGLRGETMVGRPVALSIHEGATVWRPA